MFTKIKTDNGETDMSILVLGGAGYIGSHTVREMIDSGLDVAVVDDLSTGHLEAVHPSARFYQADIRNRKLMDQIFDIEKVDGVVHFAAASLVGQSIKDPLKYYDRNLCATAAFLGSMEAHGVHHILFSSTAAAYGTPAIIPVSEDSDTAPINPYGETKLAIEKMLHWCEQAYGLRYVSMRYFNAAGAHPSGEIGEDHEPETHLIPLVLQVPTGIRQKVFVYGDDYPTKDGTCIRDYVHVTDLARAHVLSMEYLLDGGKSDVFNLGNGNGYSVYDIIKTACYVTKSFVRYEVIQRRTGDPAALVASSEKAKTILGWNPQYGDINDIVSTAWKWHSTHRTGYRNWE